jgi:hypothetical protein
MKIKISIQSLSFFACLTSCKINQTKNGLKTGKWIQTETHWISNLSQQEDTKREKIGTWKSLWTIDYFQRKYKKKQLPCQISQNRKNSTNRIFKKKGNRVKKE